MRRLGGAVAGLALVGSVAITPTATSATSPTGSGAAQEGLAPTDVVHLTPSTREAARLERAYAMAADAAATGDAGDVIDVAFLYPAALVTQSDIGGLSWLRAKFAAAVAEANTAFANSGIAVRLRHVGDAQTDTPAMSDLSGMLTALGRPGDAAYDEAQALRESTHADLVSMWINGSVTLGDSCGIGNLGGVRPATDPEYAAFTIMYWTDCQDRFLVFAHEIGHNLSGDHDAGANAAPQPTSKPYARGLTDPAHGFVTVMAYWDACTRVGVACTKIPYYSGPGVVTSQGHPTGSAAADNVRAISEQAPTVANYRQSQIYGAVPTIAGRAHRGQVLTASTPGWLPASVSMTYQWAADGVPIPGAVSGSFVVGKEQVGTTLTVTATGAGPSYTPVSMVSAPTGVVGKRLFAKTTRPRLKGTARVGRTLRVVMRAWKPGAKVSYRYTWLRDGKKIKGAKGRPHRLTRKDRGHSVTVVVTGKRRGFESESRSSKAVTVRR